jgi:hypothetical protein
MNMNLQSDYVARFVMAASAACTESKQGSTPSTCVTANNVRMRSATPVIANPRPVLWQDVNALIKHPNPAESMYATFERSTMIALVVSWRTRCWKSKSVWIVRGPVSLKIFAPEALSRVSVLKAGVDGVTNEI